MKTWAMTVLLAFASTLIGCSDAGFLGAGRALSEGGNFAGGIESGEFGATAGGVQDMGLARELIANGQVPPPEAFSVEGMFSEHDLPVSGPVCDRRLCLRAATGITAGADGGATGWVQVGLSSNVDPDRFQRDSLSLVAVVDVSGSMGWDYTTDSGDYGTPAAVALRLLRLIAMQLGADDRIAIVTFGSSVKTVLPFVSGAATDVVQGAIDGIGHGGSTNMEAGLRQAFDLAGSAQDEHDTRQTRVALFTDVQPNVGLTGGDGFASMADEAAGNGIGLTVFGVGLGLGQQVMATMSTLRGGNAFSLFVPPDADQLMLDNWPWMFSPIAHDLVVHVQSVPPTLVRRGFGFPTGDASDPGLDVGSVFLSKNRGALLLELGGPFNGPFQAELQLAYTQIDGMSVNETLSIDIDRTVAPGGQWFSQPGVNKTVALAGLVTAMAAASAGYAAGRLDDAILTMRSGIDQFDATINGAGDSSVDRERDLARDLLKLMEQGAPVGDLYGFR